MRRATILLVLAGLVAVAAPASAQVPAVPEPPQEVTDALYDANATIRPYVLEGAAAVEPGVNAVGFAARPACVHASTIALAFALGGVPLKPGLVTTPYSAYCKGALRGGPADPALALADQAVGDPAYAAADPALAQVNELAVEPARTSISPVCLVMSLGGPTALPPPLSAFNPTYELCWR